MKASSPWIFLIMLNALLVNGMVERSAKVAAVSWPKQWLLPPYEAQPGHALHIPRAKTLFIWENHYIKFDAGDAHTWTVFNPMDCEVLITAHFKHPNGQDSKTDFTFPANSTSDLNIPLTTELIIDVVSVDGLH
ncbi:hypothetical protein PGT21_019043 [Puccinia graminis f. sp. tritici]|uniref:Uncharacterized protein n=1 Tax=Puccinia graminis f. sp. tritici TaxID=56615 RepID=A0A5B0P9Q2_PUCGR|nr:hypothetical protein PGT21_019043 [Puccinia graminis f. sp. tritici]KAA1126017.1 hypothetical protein PGTUg99_011850 [Puccinia graminis f. sp. tritici]